MAASGTAFSMPKTRIGIRSLRPVRGGRAGGATGSAHAGSPGNAAPSPNRRRSRCRAAKRAASGAMTRVRSVAPGREPGGLSRAQLPGRWDGPPRFPYGLGRAKVGFPQNQSEADHPGRIQSDRPHLVTAAARCRSAPQSTGTSRSSPPQWGPGIHMVRAISHARVLPLSPWGPCLAFNNQRSYRSPSFAGFGREHAFSADRELRGNRLRRSNSLADTEEEFR